MVTLSSKSVLTAQTSAGSSTSFELASGASHGRGNSPATPAAGAGGGGTAGGGGQDAGQLDTLHGVYLPCLQSILGVILFLRLTHITSQSGTIFTTLIILASTTSTLLTWSSLSAIVTNGQIDSSSGPYYILSRTLGADIGCSLATLYYLGNTLSGSMFALGAVEALQHSVRAYYARWGYGFSGHLFRWDQQVMSAVVVVSMAGCVHFGAGWASLFSNLFLAVTMTSIACMCVGCLLFALDLSDGNLQPYDRAYFDSLWPRFEPDPYTGTTPDIFTCLALIYPCVTGILSGMSRATHLARPERSIPRGMFMAIVTSSSIYLMVCWLFGLCISNRTLKVDKFVTASVSYPHELIVRVGVVVSCLGLILGCMSSAPNLIASMSSDEVIPFLGFLKPPSADGSGRETVPKRALWFTALLVGLPTLGGNLDKVSPYATIFYLLMYAGLNMSTCVSGYVKPPGWRPTFRYSHWSVSFVGFVWCLGLSFCISGVGTFVSLLAFILMHAYIKKARRLANSGVKWGTLGSAVRYNIVTSALNSLAKSSASAMPSEVTMSVNEKGTLLRQPHLSDGSHSVLSGVTYEHDEETINFYRPNSDFHAKNWRPQLLTIIDVDYQGAPTNLHVMSMAAQLQKTGMGVNVVISIIDRSQISVAADVASAVENICADELQAEDDMSLRTVSVKSDRWRNEEDELTASSGRIDHHDTIRVIQRSKGLLMSQMKREGMDGFAEVSTTNGRWFEALWSAVIHTGLGPLSPNTILLSLPTFEAFDETARALETSEDASVSNHSSLSIACEGDISRAQEYLRTINGILNLGKAVILFKGCPSYPKNEDVIPKRGTIDIWWIMHDGGLLLLLPFLLSRHPVWTGENDPTGKKKRKRLRINQTGAKLRLFAVTATRDECPKSLHEAVVKHLEKVRIQAEVRVIECLAGTHIAERMRERRSKQPGELNRRVTRTHNMTLGEAFGSCGHAATQDIAVDANEANISGDEFFTCAAAGLNAAIRTHSSDANLVVTNLPFIHEDEEPVGYFGFVRKVCDCVENVMFVRGSGVEVITTYA